MGSATVYRVTLHACPRPPNISPTSLPADRGEVRVLLPAHDDTHENPEDAMNIERKLQQLGIELPDFGPNTYYGANYGKMKPFHRIGNLLVLSGHVPDLPDGTKMFPGRIGAEVTVEQGYAAARQTGINCLAGIKQAIGDLDKVVALVRTLNFVVCAPGFTDPNLVSSGLTDLFAELFEEERGIGCRATIGVMSLANNHCFETWMDIECR
jgi:enamine deaminase RidA (YjgF/YER057c/UK114 family)